MGGANTTSVYPCGDVHAGYHARTCANTEICICTIVTDNEVGVAISIRDPYTLPFTSRCHSVFVPPRKCSGGTNSLADSFRPEQLRGKTYPRICSVNSVDCTHLEHCEIEFIVKQFLFT